VIEESVLEFHIPKVENITGTLVLCKCSHITSGS